MSSKGSFDDTQERLKRGVKEWMKNNNLPKNLRLAPYLGCVIHLQLAIFIGFWYINFTMCSHNAANKHKMGRVFEYIC